MMLETLNTLNITAAFPSNKVNSAFHPSGVGKSSTGLHGWVPGAGCVHLCWVASN